MKKNANYEIDFTTNTITVTRKFREAASIIGTPEFNLMKELRALNMPITERIINRTKGEADQILRRLLPDADRHDRLGGLELVGRLEDAARAASGAGNPGSNPYGNPGAQGGPTPEGQETADDVVDADFTDNKA